MPTRRRRSTSGNKVGPIALAAPLAILLVAGGCKAASEPTAAKETTFCDGVPQMALAGRVTDAANVLTLEEEARLSERLTRYEERTKHQMIVATTPSLHGARIDNFATCLGNRWRIGREGHDDGLVMLVAPQDRRVAISTGLGMEKLFPDDKALDAVKNMTTYFKRADYADGVSAGVEAIAAQTGDPQ